MTETETETRISFAKRQGWKLVREDDGEFCLYNSSGKSVWSAFDPNTTMASCVYALPIIDHNHVHTALMGMSEDEWDSFTKLIVRAAKSPLIRDVFKTPLPTLVTCFLEATKRRMNQHKRHRSK